MLISNFQIISGENRFTVFRTARYTKANRLAQIYNKFTWVQTGEYIFWHFYRLIPNLTHSCEHRQNLKQLISIYTCTIHFRILLWYNWSSKFTSAFSKRQRKGGGEGGGWRGGVGEGDRLWLFIYCYIDIKLIRLALSYSYHLPKLLVSEICYILNESEQLSIV